MCTKERYHRSFLTAAARLQSRNHIEDLMFSLFFLRDATRRFASLTLPVVFNSMHSWFLHHIPLCRICLNCWACIARRSISHGKGQNIHTVMSGPGLNFSEMSLAHPRDITTFGFVCFSRSSFSNCDLLTRFISCIRVLWLKIISFFFS